MDAGVGGEVACALWGGCCGGPGQGVLSIQCKRAGGNVSPTVLHRRDNSGLFNRGVAKTVVRQPTVVLGRPTAVRRRVCANRRQPTAVGPASL